MRTEGTLRPRSRTQVPESRTLIPNVTFFFYTRLPHASGFPPPREFAQPARDCWLYFFESSQAGINFLHEVEATQEGKYRLVDLDRQFGKSPRPAGQKELDAIPLRATETLSGTPLPITYWVLASPFQLHWSRLPDLGGRRVVKRSDRRFNELQRWFHERELAYCRLDDARHVEASNRGPWKLFLWSPWSRAEAHSDEFLMLLNLIEDEEKNTKDLPQLRYLYAAVRALGDEAYLNKYLDMGELESTRHVFGRIRALHERAEVAASGLASYMRSRAFSAMVEDSWAGDVQTNQARMRPVLAKPNERLVEAKAGRDYQLEFFRQNTPLFLFEFNDLRILRKVIKAEWNLLKVPITYASGDRNKEVSLAVAERVRKFARVFAGVELTPHFEDKPGERVTVGPDDFVVDAKAKPPSRIRFSEDSVQRLRSKTSEHPGLNGLVAAVELINAAAALSDFVDSLDEGGLAPFKASAALAGAIASALSGAAGVASSIAPDELTVKAYDKLRAEFPDNAALEQAIGKRGPLEADQLAAAHRNGMRREAARMARSRTFKARLGAVAGLADVATGSVDVFRGAQRGDWGTLGGGLFIAFGGAVSAVGYYVALGYPAGATLVFVGSALSLVGTTLTTRFSKGDLELWLEHCQWGKRRHSGSAARERWSTVPLGGLHRDPEAQIHALHEILFGLHTSCDFDRAGLAAGFRHVAFTLRVAVRYLDDSSRVKLELYAETPQGVLLLHPFSPWRGARTSLAADGTPNAFERTYNVAGVLRVRGKIQIDVLCDDRVKHPNEPKPFEFTPSVFSV